MVCSSGLPPHQPSACDVILLTFRQSRRLLGRAARPERVPKAFPCLSSWLFASCATPRGVCQERFPRRFMGFIKWGSQSYFSPEGRKDKRECKENLCVCGGGRGEERFSFGNKNPSRFSSLQFPSHAESMSSDSKSYF